IPGQAQGQAMHPRNLPHDLVGGRTRRIERNLQRDVCCPASRSLLRPRVPPHRRAGDQERQEAFSGALAHPPASLRLYLLARSVILAAKEVRMRNRLRRHGVAATALVAAAVVAAAGSAWAAPRSAARLSVHTTEFGKALFGPSGKVLYVFGADRGSTSRCYGACAAGWPPLLTKGAPLAGAGVDTKLVGMIKRTNGTLQVTYNGHPLYYYSADKIGKVMCQHANMHGGLWLIIKPSGLPNMAKGTMHM